MQTLRSGSLKGNEVARRLNACEERSLQKEVCRFEKEHEKRMREFFNERYEVRETMKDLRIGHIKNLLPRVQKINKSNTLHVQSWRGALEKSENPDVNFSVRDTVDTKMSKTPRKIGMTRSTSVPNLLTSTTLKEVRNHDSKHDLGINTDKPQKVSAKTRQKMTKSCRWVTAGGNAENFDEKEFVSSESENEGCERKCTTKGDGLCHHVFSSTCEIISRKPHPKTSLANRNFIPKKCDQSLKTCSFSQDDLGQRPTTSNLKKRSKSDLTPFIAVEKSKSTRPISFLSTGQQNQNENVSSQQRLQLKTDKLKALSVHNDSHFSKCVSPRAVSSFASHKAKVSSVRFLTVSETVLATQKLIKSYRRQQAIKKATQELKRKQSSNNVLLSRRYSTNSLDPKEKFKSAVTAVIAVNAFKRNLKAMQK